MKWFHVDAYGMMDLPEIQTETDAKIVSMVVDRGVTDVEELGLWLRDTFPNLEYLYISQNYSSISNDDEWCSFKRLYTELKLIGLCVNDEQSENDCKHFEPFEIEELNSNGFVLYFSAIHWDQKIRSYVTPQAEKSNVIYDSWLCEDPTSISDFGCKSGWNEQ